MNYKFVFLFCPRLYQYNASYCGREVEFVQYEIKYEKYINHTLCKAVNHDIYCQIMFLFPSCFEAY